MVELIDMIMHIYKFLRTPNTKKRFISRQKKKYKDKCKMYLSIYMYNVVIDRYIKESREIEENKIDKYIVYLSIDMYCIWIDRYIKGNIMLHRSVSGVILQIHRQINRYKDR